MDFSQVPQLSLSQVNQQVNEFDAFQKTDLFTAFCQDFDAMLATSTVFIVDEAAKKDMDYLLTREQVIGEIRAQRTARNWFAERFDELKQKQITLTEELKSDGNDGDNDHTTE